MSHPTGNRTNKVDDRRNLYVLGLPFALTKYERLLKSAVISDSS